MQSAPKRCFMIAAAFISLISLRSPAQDSPAHFVVQVRASSPLWLMSSRTKNHNRDLTRIRAEEAIRDEVCWRVREFGATQAVLKFKAASTKLIVAYRWDYGLWMIAPLAKVVELQDVPECANMPRLLEWRVVPAPQKLQRKISIGPLGFTELDFTDAIVVSRASEEDEGGIAPIDTGEKNATDSE